MFAIGYPKLERIFIAPANEWTCPSKAWTVVRANSGVVYCLDKAHPREISAGELVVSSSGSPLVFRASQIESAELDFFNFNPMILNHFLTLPERIDFAFAAGKLGNSIIYLPPSHAVAKQFTVICEMDSSGQTFYERAHLLALVATIFISDFVPKPFRSTASSSSIASRFWQLVNTLPEAELLQRSSNMLAQYCGCSPAYVASMFRKSFGVQLRRKQFEFRMEKAKWLLTETDAKIAEVGLECGYRDPKIFRAVFKRHLGVSATAWRQQAEKGVAELSAGDSFDTPRGRPEYLPPLEPLANQSNGLCDISRSNGQ